MSGYASQHISRATAKEGRQMAFIKTRVTVFASLLLGLSLAHASDFVAYEGKDAIQEGKGGEKKTVDGIDFWSNGAPPRKFKIIGFVTDSRLKSGLIGMIRMSGLDSSIAKEAKKAGGDAVVLTNAESVTKAYVSNTQANTTTTANTTGNFNATTNGNSTTGTFGATTTAHDQSNSTTFAAPIEQQHSKYAVIKYLADN
jgi:hypothetical protein